MLKSLVPFLAVMALTACQQEGNEASAALSTDDSSPAGGLVCTDGFGPGEEDYRGFDELETFEQQPPISDAMLLKVVAKEEGAPSFFELHRQQLALARAAVMICGGPYGAALAAGEYLEDPDTSWQHLEMTDVAANDKPLDVVHFNERDDGSHTVVFEANSTKILYVYYEN